MSVKVMVECYSDMLDLIIIPIMGVPPTNLIKYL